MKLTTYSRLTRDQARKHDSHLLHYNNDVTGVQQFPVISPRELLHGCDILSCNISNYPIKRQSERYNNCNSYINFVYFFEITYRSILIL